MVAPTIGSVWQRTQVSGDGRFRVDSEPSRCGYIKVVNVVTGAHHWAAVRRFGSRYVPVYDPTCYRCMMGDPCSGYHETPEEFFGSMGSVPNG